MSPVVIADLHGRLDLLDAALARFPDRQIVFLGDYVDRGPDSRGVIARVRQLVEAGRAVALMGNHDEMMIHAVLKGRATIIWDGNGGLATRANYAGDPQALKADARWLRDNLQQHTVIGTTLFAHALRPDPSGEDTDIHLWGRPGNDSDRIHRMPEGVTASVHGHTIVPQPVQMDAWDGTKAFFIDTGAFHTGVLSVLDTETWAIERIVGPSAARKAS